MNDKQLFDAFNDIDSHYLNEQIRPFSKRRRNIIASIGCGIIALILVILCIVPLQKLFKHGFYLSHIDDKYYIYSVAHPSDSNSVPQQSNHIGHGVEFGSVQEMYDDFINQNFSEYEIWNIQKLLEENHGIISVPDLHKLSEPICPKDVMIEPNVTWSGRDTYSFCVSVNSMNRLSFSTSTQEDYESAKERLFNYTGDEKLSLILERKVQVDDRNATIYYTKSLTNGHRGKFLVYTLTAGDKTIIVHEMFMHTDDQMSIYIKLFIKEGDRYGSVYMDGYSYRPDEDWLLSFGLCPFN
jgi:hypothetical protein